ncbi:MAG: class I SAM-dependent methyltransferase [Acidimicrobiales bacterium]
MGRAASRLTGERPHQGVTPDSLLALHDAGYRAVSERLGPGRLLDVGCGQGFESVRLMGEGRPVVGVDYSPEATADASRRFGPDGLAVACMDAARLGFSGRTFDWVTSSHLIEHFTEPAGHVAEMARVLADGGTAFFLTPNRPADFENPFHVHLFDRRQLADICDRHFAEVWVGGVDAVPDVKADFAARRERARRLLRLDLLDLRHRIPHRWYVAAYTRLLPVAYRLMARRGTGGATGITAEDWFVTEDLDDSTLVLFAVARRPRRPGPARPGAAAGV